jgi:hypothetical protein
MSSADKMAVASNYLVGVVTYRIQSVTEHSTFREGGGNLKT